MGQCCIRIIPYLMLDASIFSNQTREKSRLKLGLKRDRPIKLLKRNIGFWIPRKFVSRQ